MIKNNIFFIFVLILCGLFMALLVGNNDTDNEKYCGLSKEVDGNSIQLSEVYYEMEKEVEDYSSGEVINGKIVGKLIGWSGELDKEQLVDYVCWYDFNVRKGNIIEKVTVQHIFNGTWLIDWRDS